MNQSTTSRSDPRPKGGEASNVVERILPSVSGVVRATPSPSSLRSLAKAIQAIAVGTSKDKDGDKGETSLFSVSAAAHTRNRLAEHTVSEKIARDIWNYAYVEFGDLIQPDSDEKYKKKRPHVKFTL